MANMKLTRLSVSEYKLDSAEDFCLNAHGNSMVLLGNSHNITVFELMNGCDNMILMPYSNKQVAVSQIKPISKIIEAIDLVKIYESATVQESQELALDLIYTADCAVEPVKARPIQANLITVNDRNICCILTTYGCCEIFQKVGITSEWKSLDTNLSNILIAEIFPLQEHPANIKTYNDLKDFTSKFIITCFMMSLLSSQLVIYLGTAAGYVVALKYDQASHKFEKYCHLKTSLNFINYIAKCNNFLLVASDQGKVVLVKINFDNASLQELDYLWNKPDRMSCRKAVFNYSEDLTSYLVVFCKSAHLLAYRLDLEGVVMSSTSLYVSGIKITGIESISVNEFIITTILGTVKYIKISCPTKDGIHIEEQNIDHEFDSANYQILGVAASASKNLWSFLLYRNKDYVHQSKYFANSAFINVCKLNNEDSFEKLIKLDLKNMNIAQDLVLAINLDIFNHTEHAKYMNYFSLETINVPKEINDAFVLKLQIKIIITRKLGSYQNIKYKKLKPQTKTELQILEPVLQMLHILLRLKNLKELKSKLSKFQQLSIASMQSQFNHLLNHIVTIDNGEDDPFQKAIEKIATFCKDEFKKYKFGTSSFSNTIENCMLCDKPITNFVKCEQEHDIKRCSISCTQLTLFKTIHCPHCHTLARNDDDAKLKELFAPGDDITCIYCRFLLKEDELLA